MRLLLRVVVAALAVCLIAIPGFADGQSLSDRIEREWGRVESGQARAGVLTSEIAGLTGQVGGVSAELQRLASRRSTLDRELDRALSRVERVQADLRNERARLARLRARLSDARVALSRRLVGLYKADNPDVLSVVLNADGFVDLLERSEFSRRVAQQDARVIGVVRRAKADAQRAERRLAPLQRSASAAAASIEQRRDAAAAVEAQVAARRAALERARERRRVVLSQVRGSVTNSRRDLAGLEQAQVRVQARLAKVATVPAPAGESGRLAWPTNGTVTSGFGQRWGRLHAGLDIAVPEGTPVRAAASGRVEISAWTGGYGNYVCVSHDGGLSSCYAHNSRPPRAPGSRCRPGI